jgi:Short C-terminal domain
MTPWFNQRKRQASALGDPPRAGSAQCRSCGSSVRPVYAGSTDLFCPRCKSIVGAVRLDGELVIWVAAIGPLELYPDRLELRDQDEPRSFILTSDVRASVETAGNLAATRGRDLAQKAAGTALTEAIGAGALGAFLFGNAAERVIDARELYLLVEANDWVYAHQAHPSTGRELREFALELNLAVRRLSMSEAVADPAREYSQRIQLLERLSELRRQGALTDEEFNEEKRRLLNG